MTAGAPWVWVPYPDHVPELNRCGLCSVTIFAGAGRLVPPAGAWINVCASCGPTIDLLTRLVGESPVGLGAPEPPPPPGCLTCGQPVIPSGEDLIDDIAEDRQICPACVRKAMGR